MSRPPPPRARASLGTLVGLAVPAGLVLATALLGTRTTYLPLRAALVAMVAVLGVLQVVGARVLFPAPADRSPLVLAVRTGGALAVAWTALSVVLVDASDGGDAVDRARTGVPVLTVLLALLLTAFLVSTSGAPESAVAPARGAALGAGCAALWLAACLITPPLPSSGWSAALVVGLAGALGVRTGAPRGAALLTGLCTAMAAALSVVLLVGLALACGPAAWVPPDSAALTPAARLAQSRVEAGEGYLSVLLLGALAALGVLVLRCAGVRAGRRALQDVDAERHPVGAA